MKDFWFQVSSWITLSHWAPLAFKKCLIVHQIIKNIHHERKSPGFHLPGIALWTRWQESGHPRCEPSLPLTSAWTPGGSSTSRPLLHEQNREVRPWWPLKPMSSRCLESQPTCWMFLQTDVKGQLVCQGPWCLQTGQVLEGQVSSAIRFDHTLRVNHGRRCSPCCWRSGEGGWRDRREGFGVHPPDRPDRKYTRGRVISFSHRITHHSIRVSMLDERKSS